MTADDFAAWVALMQTARHWSAARCARELSCGKNQIAIWSRRGAPDHIGLACAALAYGLPAWRDPKGKA